MKKLTTLIFAMVLSLAAMAEQPHKVYCEVWGTSTTNIIGYLYIDYGQEDRHRNWLVDDNGKGIYFDTMIQALNYMAKRGWELEAAYDTQRSKTMFDETKIESKHSLILSKMVTSDDEITEGFCTRSMYKNH